jgi:hypothetical protein
MTKLGVGWGGVSEISYQMFHLSLPVIRMDLSKLQISPSTRGLKIKTYAGQAVNHEIFGVMDFLGINLTKSIF